MPSPDQKGTLTEEQWKNFEQIWGQIPITPIPREGYPKTEEPNEKDNQEAV